MDNHKVYDIFIKQVADFFIPASDEDEMTVLEQAKVFEKFINPNKNFARFPVMIEAADGLADALEKEISSLKESDAPERDEKLAAARTTKKAVRGFITYANKEGLLDEPISEG